MVVRLQKLSVSETADASILSADSQSQALNELTGKSLLDQTVEEETLVETTQQQQEEDIEEEEETETISATLPLRNRQPSFDCASSIADGSYATDASFDEDLTVNRSPRKSRNRHIRDRSNTWSHSGFASKPAKRSGSLPPMECAMSPALSRLSLDRGDSPFPTTPTALSPRKLTNRLLVCSEHRMSTSPRLPPIGAVNHPSSPRLLPKNSPRELSREVTLIDPALVESNDPTDVRMMGRRRNALLTAPPSSMTDDKES